MLGLAVCVAVAFSAASLGAVFTPGAWYQALHKPSWNPPSWIFGPVWTALYASMGIAAWLVWRRGGWRRQRRALSLFVVQLALNAAWTPIFFGWHAMGIAFVEIVVLWIAIAATLVAFWREHTLAGVLLLPYLAWVSFAAVLNFTVWRLNS